MFTDNKPQTKPFHHIVIDNDILKHSVVRSMHILFDITRFRFKCKDKRLVNDKLFASTDKIRVNRVRYKKFTIYHMLYM